MQNSGLTRRKLIYGSLAFAGTSSLLRSPASAASTLPPTPRQTPGPFYPLSFPAGCRQRSGPCRRAPGDGSGQHHADHRAHSRPEWTACSRSTGRDLAMRRERPLPLCPGWPGRSAARREFPGIRGHDRPIRPAGISSSRSGRCRIRAEHRTSISPSRVAASSGSSRRCTWPASRETMSDPVLMGVRDPAARARLIVALRPSPDVGPDGMSGVFDIVLG